MGLPLYFGVEDPEAVFIGWGSTYGVIKEATEKACKGRL